MHKAQKVIVFFVSLRDFIQKITTDGQLYLYGCYGFGYS